MYTDLGFTGGAAGYGMMYAAGKKTGKTDNDDMVVDIVARVEERAALLKSQREVAEAAVGSLWKISIGFYSILGFCSGR